MVFIKGINNFICLLIFCVGIKEKDLNVLFYKGIDKFFWFRIFRFKMILVWSWKV